MSWDSLLANYHNLDCGDNSCRYKKTKGGMRTNGGCRCSRNHGPDVERFLSHVNAELQQKVYELERNIENPNLGKIGEGYV